VPDVAVPQLTDEDYKDRPRVREADLRRHLLSQVKADDALLEQGDDRADPRFSATAAELEKKGIEDFQLDYAIKTLKRLAPGAMASAQTSGPPRKQ
jgi:carboxyl-terminal processing protease